MDKIAKNKGPGTSDQKLFTKPVEQNFFISNDVTSLMMLYNLVFELFKKIHLLIYASQFMT